MDSDNHVLSCDSLYITKLSLEDNDKEIDSASHTSYEVDLDSNGHPTGERWPPLGAPTDDDDSLCSFQELGRRSCASGAELDRLKELEHEQEQLNNSLFALATHFAQVQFRLKQIVDASPAEKEKLLIELECFANRGVPDTRTFENCEFKEEDAETRLDLGQERQKELIDELKQQLEDLENYAYETGEAGLPQSIVLKKQKIILDELKGKLNLNMDIDKLSFEDLKLQVNSAVKELINPKEQLLKQLHTQVIDLERFIEFLQGGEVDTLPSGSACDCEGHVQPERPKKMHTGHRKYSFRRRKSSTNDSRQQLRNDTENLINKASTLISMLTLAQFGCGSSKFESNSLKKTSTGYHWGDLRATLEIAVDEVIKSIGPFAADCNDYSSDSDEAAYIESKSVTLSVRKQLSPALCDLMQHGLMKMSRSLSVVPFLACFPHSSISAGKMMHAWDLIIKYYDLKKGEQYNKTPARRLSQSFQLEITGSTATTAKQSLLQTVGNILSTHAPLKRSADSQFKAFICAALNEKKLVVWLRLIFRTPSLLEEYYTPWSYAAKTGFEDSLKLLDKLTKYNFNLPVNLAIKSFENIKHVF